jgi:6-phosphogluconolactonase
MAIFMLDIEHSNLVLAQTPSDLGTDQNLAFCVIDVRRARRGAMLHRTHAVQPRSVAMSTDSPLEKPQISVWPDSTALMEAAALRIVAIARNAIAQRGQFVWALSGGSTPRPLYELLGSKRFASALDWRRVLFFWSDERCVGPDHPDSNFRMARLALLDRLPLSAAQVQRMHGEDEPSQAAADYEQQLRAHLGAAGGLDLVLLGLGSDGHIASLFPGSSALQETVRWVASNLSPAGAQRLTFTLPALNAAEVVLLLVAGADKAARVKQALHEPGDVLPVQRIHPSHGRVEWMLDTQAAGGLI